MLKTMFRSFISLLLLAGCLGGCSTLRQNYTQDLLPALSTTSTNITRVLESPASYRVQILIAEPLTNRTGGVSLRRSGYRVGAEYFYPASAIKLCAAIGALQTIEKLQDENQTGDLLEVPLEIAPLFPGDSAQTNDNSNLEGGFITVGQEIRKLCLVSDNQSFNRLYDVIGHKGLNDTMHALGLSSAVINHRLSESRTIPDMRASAAVIFHEPNRGPIVIPARHSELSLTNGSRNLFLGTGYRNGDTLVNEPMDFSRRNGIALADLQDLLVKLARPDVALTTPKLNLSPAHRAMLLQAMSLYPGESSNPVYSPARFPALRSKFLLPGIRRVFPQEERGVRIEITGKPGQAYGFSIENSYVRNPANGRAVFVTAVLYSNSDGILNDDKYDYATVAEPFLADLGEWVARHYLMD